MANQGKISLTLIALTGLSACHPHPGLEQITAWRQAAIAENQRLLEANATVPQNEWKLLIQGQTQKSERLNWQTLNTLATTRIKTREPMPGSVDKMHEFRGVLVSKLLDRLGVAPGVDSVTFVAFDAYRATVRLEDIRRYPILLAIERDGKPMTRSEGGPIKLVFPSSQFPELGKRYDDTAWVFYVTHLVVGTESPRLQIGHRTLQPADLDRIPSTTIKTPVSYRGAWANGEIYLQGNRIQDLMPSLPDKGWVIVRGKAPIHRDSEEAVRIPIQALKLCDVILARRWGNNFQPIAAQMGGPLTLAFAPNCDAIARKFPWVTFVESLEVAR